MFIPATADEIRKLGWTKLDVILITGDSYIDSPFVGVSVIGRRLLAAGYRVGIIPQPDIASGRDITRFGEPELFWGVTGGCIDSLVANRTLQEAMQSRVDDLDVTLLARPVPPPHALTPPFYVIALLGLIVGLMLSSGVAIAVEFSEGRIRDAEAVRRILRAPVLAEIPKTVVQSRRRRPKKAAPRRQMRAAA